MNARAGQGRPLRFLLLLIAGWIGIRTATWTSPWPEVPQLGAVAIAASASAAKVGIPQAAVGGDRRTIAASPLVSKAPPVLRDLSPLSPVLAPVPARTEAPSPFASGRTAASQNLLWMAGMAALPMPQSVADWLDRNQPVARSALPAQTPGPSRLADRVRTLGSDRWHFDSWAQWRPGAGAASGSGQPALLGGSQGGVLASWRLAASDRAPALLVRLTGSPAAGLGPARGELAAGVRVRPLAAVPLSVQGELRAVRQGGVFRTAPAAFVTGGFDAVPVAAGVKLRSYAAAGWVGGKDATGFAEGQLLAEREVASRGSFRIDAGIGSWGAVQRGASRVDVGPTLSLRVPVGDVEARLQADYRLRLAGDAAPGSGPAITLSTGF